MTTQYTPLPTANTEWGFYGCWQGTDEEKAQAYAKMSELINSVVQHEPIDIRNFLDSPAGRHLADHLVDEEGHKLTSIIYGRLLTFMRGMFPLHLYIGKEIKPNRAKFEA